MEEINNPADIKKEKDYILPLSILLAGFLISGAVIYSVGVKNTPELSQGRKAPLTAALNESGAAIIEPGDDVILGDPKAKVTLIEFGDYQCPFCGRFFTETEGHLRSEYIETGKVRMVYKDFAFLGPESLLAAQGAECAKDQSKYWEYHDGLYKMETADNQENNGNISLDVLKRMASELGLNRVSFDSCLDSKKYEEEVKNDYNEGQAIGVRSTPTVFINGQRIEGALPYSVFKEAIDQALTP